MTGDILKERPALFLGSRLKRLAERMQADVASATLVAGLKIQPAQYSVLGTLGRYGPQTIGELTTAMQLSQPGITRMVAKLSQVGFVTIDRLHKDQRHKTISLTPAGQEALEASKRLIWPNVEAAVEDVLGELKDSFFQQLDIIEARLAERSLGERMQTHIAKGLRIHEFSEALAPLFRSINAQWIEAMYEMEQADRDVLDHPREKIIDKGGDILFVEAEGLGIVGTCALKKTGENEYELNKMGVLAEARGLKVGEYLLKAVIDRAKQKGAKRLYLLSNKKSEVAVYLYEKLGFQHDEQIMKEFGSHYVRCDVAMLYKPKTS